MDKTSKTKLLTFIIMLNVTIIAAATAMVLFANQSESFAYYTRFRGSTIPSGYHYEATDATRTTSATKEYWVACNTHDHYLLQDPEADEIDFVDDISNDSSTGFTVKLSDPYWVGSSTWDGTRVDAVYPAGKGISTGNTSVMGEISFTFSSAYTSGESITIKEGSSFLSDSNGSDVYYSVPNCYEFIYDGSSWSLNKTPVYGNWVEGVTPSPDISEFFQGTDDRWARYDKFDGSEVQMWVKNNDVTFGSVSTTVGGRTGTFYEFDTTPVAGYKPWEDKLIFYHASHDGPDANYNPYVRTANSSDLRRLLFKDRIHYATFDICFSSGSLAFGVATYDGSTYVVPTFTYLGDGTYIKINVGDGTYFKQNNNITCYELNGQEATTISNNTWYRVVVKFDIYNEDGSFIESPSNMYAGITVDNLDLGVSYFDNVRYYRDSSWWDDFDVDKGLTASVSNPVVSMNTYTPSVSNVIFRGEELSSSDYSTRVTISDPSIGSVSDKTVSVGEGGFKIYVSISVGEKRIYSIKSLDYRHETTFVPSKLKANNDGVTVTNNVSAAGRTGVTQFTWPNYETWDTAYAFEPTATTSADMTPDKIAKAFVGSGIKYMSFEFSITSGSIFRVYSRLAEDSSQHMWKRVVASTGNIETHGTYPNNQVTFYDMSDNVITSGLVVGSWYKCVVDYSFITTALSSTYFDVMFNAAQGTYYVDNVYYYSTSATPWGAQ